MSQEYFEHSKSKTSFVIFGIIVAFILIFLISPSTYPDKKNTVNTEEIYLPTYQEQHTFHDSLRLEIENNVRALESEMQRIQQQIDQEKQRLVEQISTMETNSSSLSTSLYLQDGELVGFVKSSEKETLESYKKQIKKYAKIIKSDKEGFSFVAENQDNFEKIYEILGEYKISFNDVWAWNW